MKVAVLGAVMAMASTLGSAFIPHTPSLVGQPTTSRLMRQQTTSFRAVVNDIMMKLADGEKVRW